MKVLSWTTWYCCLCQSKLAEHRQFHMVQHNRMLSRMLNSRGEYLEWTKLSQRPSGDLSWAGVKPQNCHGGSLLLNPEGFITSLFFYCFIYLFLERGEGEEEGEKHQWVRDDLQPRHVPWLGIKPVTRRSAGWCSIHWATPARASSPIHCPLIPCQRG